MYCSPWVSPPNLCRPLVMFDHLNTWVCMRLVLISLSMILSLSYPSPFLFVSIFAKTYSPLLLQLIFKLLDSGLLPPQHILSLIYKQPEEKHNSHITLHNFVSMTWKYICINLTERWWKESQRYTWDKPICQFYSIWLIYIVTFLWQSCGWSICAIYLRECILFFCSCWVSSAHFSCFWLSSSSALSWDSTCPQSWSLCQSSSPL